MSISANDVRECLIDGLCNGVKFDFDRGYARIPDDLIANLERDYRALVEKGEMEQSLMDEFMDNLSRENELRAQANEAVKADFGPNVFYGMKGIPLLRRDRWAMYQYDGRCY